MVTHLTLDCTTAICARDVGALETVDSYTLDPERTSCPECALALEEEESPEVMTAFWGALARAREEALARAVLATQPVCRFLCYNAGPRRGEWSGPRGA